MLSAFDRRILDEVQGDFPLVPRPFAVLAERLHTDEDALLARLEALREAGYLRRFGAYFDSGALGYRGTLVALRVADGAVEAVAEAVNRYGGVTHNYERDGEYNLWFTFQYASEDARRETLDAVRRLPGVERMLDLPSKKRYKVRVRFRLT